MWFGWQSWPGRPRPRTKTLTTGTWNVAMLGGEGARACAGGRKAPARAGRAHLHAPSGARLLERGPRSTPVLCSDFECVIFLYSRIVSH